MGGNPDEQPRRLSDFLRDHGDEILAAWETDVRSLRVARDLPRPLLIDHLPQFLDDLAGYVDHLRAGVTAGEPPKEDSRIHALERLGVGYDLVEVVKEYGILRECITRLSARVEREGALLLRDASADPAVAQSPTCAPGTRAMYGIQLQAGDVLGSVAMGSRSSSEFSNEDQLLFRTMVNRAAELIAQARLQAEVARRAAETEAVIQSIPEAVLVGDEKGYRRANAAALELMGARTPAEIKSPGEPGGIRARWLDGRPVLPEEHVFLKALRGERGTMQVSVTHAGKGSEVVLQVSAAPIEMEGRIVGVVAVNTDITDRVRMEQELRAVLEFRDQMLGVLSHDLKNPLGVILASSFVLERAPLDDAQKRSLGRVTSNARRIDRMIRDLLDYTRARLERKLPIAPREADFLEVCRTAVDELQVLNPDRAIRLDAHGSMSGNFDPDRVAQVVANLVGNALRYSNPGTPVEVSLRQTGAGVLMEIHNQGPPISPHLLPRIFEPFHRGEGEGGEGLGLGLYIVKQIVEAHGGSVEVRSTAGEGTTFSVLWPKR